MLPVWQEVPHHSVGPGPMLNCAKRQHAEPELIYMMSHHLFVKGCPHTCTQADTVLRLSVGLFSNVSLIWVMDAAWALAGIKVSAWQDLFLTLLLFLWLLLTHSLFHCVVIGMYVRVCVCVCVCWCGLWNWWMTSHGRFIVRILVQLERKLMASWDYGGLRANTCLFHQETWGHFFTPSQIRATPPPPALLLLTPSNSSSLPPQHKPSPSCTCTYTCMQAHTCSRPREHAATHRWTHTPLPGPQTVQTVGCWGKTLIVNGWPYRYWASAVWE